MKKLKITCKYYKVCELKNSDVTDNLFDLRSWITGIRTKTLEGRFKDVDGVRGRLENVDRLGTETLFSLNFMRFDDVSTTYKLNAIEPAEHIDLEPDEYIAKNTVCLYDAEKHIMMIQSNRGGYSERSIQSYINSFINEESQCVLLPIMERVDFFNSNADFMKLDFRLANYSKVEAKAGSGFEQIIEGMNKFEGVNAHIEITMGRDYNSSLHKGNVKKLLADLLQNRGLVSKANVKLSDDQVSGIYDLFENLCKDEVECETDQKGGINYEYLSNKMLAKYQEERVLQRITNALS